MCKQCPKGSTGAVVWRGPSAFDGAPIVVIVTWHSTNRKTGDMAQVWILREDMLPTDAIASGEDASICGTCVHRKTEEGTRSCYVNVGQAPQQVWRTFARGGYPTMTVGEASGALWGRGVRLGAYGDPGMVPFWVMKGLTFWSAMHTGYTHQWRHLDPEWSELVMASGDTVEDRRDARKAGWRTFFVAPKGTSFVPGAVLCLSEAQGRSCMDCGACAGTRGTGRVAVDIYIGAHGSGAKYVA